MTLRLLIAFALAFSSFYVNGGSGNCTNVVFTDNFLSPTGWQMVGSGAVNISNGTCNFANVYCGTYNKVYKNLGATLSDTYWKAQCDFSILSANPVGNGTGAVIMALTADTLDFLTYDGSQNYLETNQDGIAALIASVDILDNDINNWFFVIEAKKGNIRTFDFGSVIYASSAISNYFIRLERLSKDMTQLSVFSDSAFTNHLPGSPVTFAIDSTITGLTTVQHGTSTPGYFTRLINAAIDNDFICDDAIASNIINHENKNDVLFSIYPNLTTGIINFYTRYKGKAVISLFDNMGRRVFCTDVALQKTNQIDLSSFKPGMYFLEMQAAGYIQSVKFIKH